jgi:hypothetical protein
MKIWILGILALLLLLWGLRERFTTYEEALKDVGQTTGYTSLTAGSTGGTASQNTPEPTCPSGFTIDSSKTRCTPTTGVPPTCPAGYPTTDPSPRIGKCYRTTFGEGDFRMKECPTGTTRGDGGMCYTLTQQSPTCPSGFQLDIQTSYDSIQQIMVSTGKCKSTTSTSAQATGTTGGTAGGTAGGTTTTTGTTTGGSSTSSFGPNSGGPSNRRQQVFGPTFTGRGRGEGNGVVPADSSKTSQYPELLGGTSSKPSTRIEGGGIVAPSKNWQLAMDGSLPDCKGLGCDENSKYLPFSRQPGDMDLIPDPYRVSQQFSSASYSFKTEPVPFLTDFSAFQR